MMGQAGAIDLEFWRSLQAEVTARAERNYPVSIGRPEDPLAGLVEELGELAEAIEKRDREGIVDAIADCMIYMCDFCGKAGMDLSGLVVRATGVEDNDNLDEKVPSAVSTAIVIAIGRLHHAFLKNRQNIRTSEDHPGEQRRWLARIIAILWDVYDEHRPDREVPFDAAVKLVWEGVVRKRDWRKNPAKGTP